MKIRIAIPVLGLLITALFVCAVPASAAALLSFTGTTTGGTIVAPGAGVSNAPVNTLTLVPYNSLVVSGAPTGNGPYSLTGATLNFNTATDVLTLNGAIPGLAGLSTSSTLVTIQLTNAGLTGTTNAAQSAFNLNTVTNVVSISESSTLLSDLGITGTSSLNGLGIVGSGNPNGSGTYQSISDTLGVTIAAPAVPEPASILLIAGGLAIAGCLRRKRSSVAD